MVCEFVLATHVLPGLAPRQQAMRSSFASLGCGMPCMTRLVSICPFGQMAHGSGNFGPKSICGQSVTLTWIVQALGRGRWPLIETS